MQRKKKEKLTDMVGSETIAYTPSTALGAKLVDLAEGDMKVREAPKVLGAPVSCGTCQDYFSVERCVVPYTLPCGHKHCGNCLRDVVCEFGSGKNEGKVISQCTVCRKMVTHARLSAIPRDSALAERAEGVRITYGYDGDGVQTGRIMLSPPKTVPENVRQLTDCLTHLQDACDRRLLCPFRHPLKVDGQWPAYCREWPLNFGCRDVNCPLLHPSPAVQARTDCELSSQTATCRGWVEPQRCPYRHIHPQVFDAAEPGTGSPGSRAAAVSSASSRKSPSARAHGSPVRPGVPRTPSASSTGEASGGASLTVASSAPAVPSCRRWRRNFRCTDAACPSLHPVNIYAAVPDVADPRRDGMPLPDDHEGMTAVVYWDMATCGIPDDVWWYSAATCVDRFLRVNGLLDTGAGWKFECHAAIPFLSSGKRRRELLEARVQLDVVGDSEENAVVSRLFSKFEKLTLTTYAERTSAIVIISGDDAAAAIVSKANHNGYKTVLVSQDPSRRQGPKWKSVSMHAAWSDILAVTIPSPMMVKKEAEEKAKVEREAAAMKTLLRSDVAITVVPTSEVPHRPSRRQLARTGSYVVSPTRSSMPAAKPSSRALVAAPASGAAGGAVKCPAFVPASQSGCKLEDACPLFHEKTLCPTMLASGGDSCTLGFRCPFRHVPLAGPGSRAPYLDVARGAEKDEFGHIPPRDWSTHGRSFYKKSVRKLFTVANTEWETGHLPYDVELPPPGFWTCSFCMYRFNAPPELCDGFESVCDLCERSWADVGPWCWCCPTCAFAGNTLELDVKCCYCNTKAPSPDDDDVGIRRCSSDDCLYDSRADTTVCDFCRVAPTTTP